MKFLKLLIISIFSIAIISCGNSTNNAGGGDSVHSNNQEEISFPANIDRSHLSKSVKPFLTNELTTIKSTNQILPDEQSKDYVKVYDQTDNGFRKVIVVGKELIIQKDHENAVYEFNNEATVDEINFYAETIIVKDSFRLKGGNINIFARNLEFQGKAQFITTPDAEPTDAGKNSDDSGRNGTAGEDAGDISINIENIIVPDENTLKRFLLIGAKGQKAGEGRKGGNGNKIEENYRINTPIGTKANSNINLGSSDYMFYGYPSTNHFSIEKISFNSSNSAIFINHDLGSSGNIKYGAEGGWPSNGESAKSSGVPGVGGAGGILKSNIAINASLYNISKGANGAKGETYNGGAAGEPHKCTRITLKVDRIATGGWVTGTYYSRVLETRTYKAGSNAPAPDVDPANEKSNGSLYLTNQANAWVKPDFIRTVLEYVTNLYIKGFLAETTEVANDYYNVINNYQLATGEWNSLSDFEKTEFETLKSEFKSILYRLSANKDYFGNPAGWAPRLSFEVTKDLYEQEVERSFNIMKLAHIITSSNSTIAEKHAALESQKDNLEAEIRAAIANKKEASEAMPAMQTKSQELISQLTLLQQRIEILEKNLLERAENNVEERHKGPLWKQAARFTGAVAAMCPVGAPYTNAVSSVSDIITQQGSPSGLLEWDTIKKMGSAFSGLDHSKFQESLNKLDAADSQLQIGLLQLTAGDSTLKDRWNGVQNIKDAGTFFSENIDKFEEKMNTVKVSDAEIQAELEKLKNESPEFQEFIKREKDLLGESRELATKMETAINTIAESTLTIQTSLLTINAIATDLQDSAQVLLNEDTLMYITEMDRKAKERLLKYHYYMAKAYEYRLVKPYNESLDIHGLFNKLITILQAADTNLNLQTSHFDQLKTIYSDNVISPIVETIYNRMLSNEYSVERPLYFYLGAKDLERLNSGKPVTLNLKDLGFFRENEENIRISNIRISEIETETIGDLGNHADMNIIFKHSGESYIEYNGNQYIFRHYNNLTRNSISWTTNFDPFSETLLNVKPSYATRSLIHSIINQENDVMLFARPSAWANITISKDVLSSDTSVDIWIKKARVEVDYHYTQKTENFCQLKVMPNDNQIMPLIEISKTDKNGKKDGYGSIVRTYVKNDAGAITITAPETYGEWTFEKWTDLYGNEISSSSVYTLDLKENTTLMANYKTENELILNPDETLEDLPIDELPVE